MTSRGQDIDPTDTDLRELPERTIVARRRSGSIIVACGIVTSVLTLLPGLAARIALAIDPTNPLPGYIQPINSALADIRFGSGLRFWLGVIGTALMALLLLYPLRKVLAARHGLGSISSWFRSHLLIGFAAPVTIFYHANFGLGGFNANIALWSMFAIVASGLVGHYVHSEASARNVTAAHRTRALLQAITRLVGRSVANYRHRESFISDLRSFDDERVKPRSGILRALAARFAIHPQHRIFVARAAELSPSPVGSDQIGSAINQHLNAYFAIAYRSANYALREQLWARWRLFHLPIYLVMSVAIALHVAAVWDMDQPALETPRPETLETAATPSTQNDSSIIRQLRRPTLAVTPSGAVDATKVAPSSVPPTTATNRVNSVAARLDEKSSQSSTEAQLTPAAPTPKLVRRPANATSAPPPGLLAKKVAGAPMPDAARASGSDTAAEAEMKAVYGEVQRRLEQRPMSLGGAFPRTLTEQIELLKAKQKAGQFAHTLAETGFALSGKHTRAECASCHKTPLRQERQDNPRQCIACHKQDDVHRGRRPDCASCHTTNRWSEIVRRR